MLSAKTPEERQVAKATFQKSMKYLESDLKCRNTKFFKGNELPGMLDYMIWPWMERIDVLLMVFPELNPLLPSDQFPLMVNPFTALLLKKFVKLNGEQGFTNFIHNFAEFLD